VLPDTATIGLLSDEYEPQGETRSCRPGQETRQAGTWLRDCHPQTLW